MQIRKYTSFLVYFRFNLPIRSCSVILVVVEAVVVLGVTSFGFSSSFYKRFSQYPKKLFILVLTTGSEEVVEDELEEEEATAGEVSPRKLTERLVRFVVVCLFFRLT